ncbi:hypothetical protein MNBD_GAMMA07-992 [hydrothermal vent metagenome]|uniref:SPOR domain-containing protein n=1 Tax=hydrothermal vent metagenome TaxID=652676 RepID=A0A3B0WYN6_9ZZZZ
MPTARDLKGRNMPKKKSVPGYIWMLSGLIIGLFVTFLMYLDKQPADDINFAATIKQELEKARAKNKLAAESKTAQKKPSKEKQPHSKADTESKKPQFEFYTILSELEVFIPELDIEDEQKTGQSTNTTSTVSKLLKKTGVKTSPQDKPNAKSKTKSVNKTQPRKKNYLLQAGSFKSKHDAERLKASLALLGVQSSIQSININRDNWHRVRIGPFSDTARLRETLGTLKQNNIRAMTMELK